MMFVFGFNQLGAARSFAAAADCDPDCAMCFWGLAMAYGPNINKMSLSRREAELAWDAANRARELEAHASPVERALIHAVSARHPEPTPANRKAFDQAYADAMERTLERFPDDLDVGALTAEALMNLHAWDLWTSTGAPRPGTERIVQIVNKVLAKSPDHPFALHLMIHAVEQSPHPVTADSAANRLRRLAPNIEHLLHMPSHIDVLLGRWQQGVVANERAIDAAVKYRSLLVAPEPYRLQMTHNYHTLAYAAMMQGESKKATQAITNLLEQIPEEFIETYVEDVDGFFAMPYEIHQRFGRWDAMLAEPRPRDSLLLATAFWRFGRAIAFGAKRMLKEARAEQRAFDTAMGGAVAARRDFRHVPARQILGVADKMLKGELSYREGKISESLESLRMAVKDEDSLPYTEPPIAIVPVRHALAATLLDLRRYAEAEAVCREDLVRHPENGWALYGLARSLKMQGKRAEATAAMLRFKEAWKYADFKISSTCCCLPGSHDASLEN